MSRTWRGRIKAKGRDRRGSCESGKIRYRTEEQAVEALAVIRAQPRTNHTPVRAYACPACGGHHLSSMARWPR